jgi:hypothetical protein
MDLLQEIQRRHIAAYIEQEKAKLAEITSPEFAEVFYQPTAFDSFFAL